MVGGFVDSTPYEPGARTRGKHQFPEIDKLRDKARVGVPVDVWPRGDLTQELAYGNHSSVQKFSDDVWGKRWRTWRGAGRWFSQKKQAEQVPGLRVSPVGVVEEREKMRIIHMTFEHGNGGVSVNSTTDGMRFRHVHRRG